MILTNASGGLYHFRFELIKRLCEENYEVHFCAPKVKDNSKIILLQNIGAKYIETEISRRSLNLIEDFKLIRRYKKILRSLKPNIVLTYTIKPNIYGTYIASKFNIPVIMNIAGMGTALNHPVLRFFMQYYYGYACKKAKQIFFQNQSNYKLFLSKRMILNDKGIVIPGSGVNIEKFRPLQKSKNTEKIKFIFIGRIMKEKGIEEYLEVAKRIAKKQPKAEFQILGSYEEAKYKDIVGKCNAVRYLGRSIDVRNEIKEVDCIIHPSFHEGMSNVLLESAAMGKPLIASNIPGCKEVVEHGKNGYLFEVKSPGDLERQVEKYLALTERERDAMGELSRLIAVKQFDRNFVINKYMKVIEEEINIL